MNIKFSAIGIAALLFTGCATAQPDSDVIASDTPQQADPCVVADPESRLAIEIDENKMASICRADRLGDCLYTHAFGKTFIQARSDLNSDGRRDFLIKDFSGAYGMHDVVHVMGFVGCPGNYYVKVLDDFLTNVQIKDSAPDGMWRQLQVSRACFDESRGDVVTREYTIAFDPARLVYGPPDGNPALTEFCSADELASPDEISGN